MKRAEIKHRVELLIANKRVRLVLIAILCVIVAFCVFRLLLLLCPVKEFEIQGDTKYDLNEIINAAGIRTGDRLYGISKRKVEKRLLEKCPYIENVKIKRKFPNTVCFVIQERGSGWYLQVGEDFYALDYDLKILAETFDEQLLKDRGLTKLILPEPESSLVGQYPEFGKGDERLVSETLKIIDTIRTDDIKDRLTYLDLSNRFEIKMVIDGTYSVNFGDMDDADKKFEMLLKTISDAKEDGYVGGEIYVISPSHVDFRGYFPDGAEENEDKTDKVE